jgi:hypothetical protein
MADQAAVLPMVPIKERETEAKKISDPTEKELMLRYGMETKVWQASQRNYFPYNTKLEATVAIPLVLPIAYLLYHNVKNQEYKDLSTLVGTIFVSSVGYYLTDSLIDAFKDTLAKRGLFGKDLNKAGE